MLFTILKIITILNLEFVHFSLDLENSSFVVRRLDKNDHLGIFLVGFDFQLPHSLPVFSSRYSRVDLAAIFVVSVKTRFT